MSTKSIKEYRSQPPITIERLIELVNHILGGRTRHLVSKRTIRFYTSMKVLPKPLGAPKFSRYGYEHILCILAARTLQDQGVKLDQVSLETSEVQRGRFDRMETLVDSWLTANTNANRVSIVREEKAGYDAGNEPKPDLSIEATQLIRIALTHNASMNIEQSANLKSDLKAALAALQKIVKSLE